MKNFTWQQVAVVAMIMGAVMVAIVLKRPTTELMLLGTTILAALGLGKSEQVAKQTNGNMGKLLEMVEGMAHKMAEMPPSSAQQSPEDVRPVSPAA